MLLMLIAACDSPSEQGPAKAQSSEVDLFSENSASTAAAITEAKAGAISVASLGRDRHTIDAMMSRFEGPNGESTYLKLTAINGNEGTQSTLNYDCRAPSNNISVQAVCADTGQETRTYTHSLPVAGSYGLGVGERVFAAYYGHFPSSFSIPSQFNKQFAHIFYATIGGEKAYKWVDVDDVLDEATEAAFNLASPIAFDSWDQCDDYGGIIALSKTTNPGIVAFVCEDAVIRIGSAIWEFTTKVNSAPVSNDTTIVFDKVLDELNNGLKDGVYNRMLSPDGLTFVPFKIGAYSIISEAQDLTFKGRAIGLSSWKTGWSGSAGFIITIEDDFGQDRAFYIAYVAGGLAGTGPTTVPITFNTLTLAAYYQNLGLWFRQNLWTVQDMFGPLVPGAPQYAPVARVASAAMVTIGDNTLSVSLEPAVGRVYPASEQAPLFTSEDGKISYPRYFPFEADTFHLKSFLLSTPADIDDACTTLCAADTAASTCIAACNRRAYDTVCDQFGHFADLDEVTGLGKGCLNLGQKVDLVGDVSQLDKRLEFRSIAEVKAASLPLKQVTLRAEDLNVEPVVLKSDVNGAITGKTKTYLTYISKFAGPLLPLVAAVGLDGNDVLKKKLGILGTTVTLAANMLDMFGYSDTSAENAKQIQALTTAVNKRFKVVSETMKKINTRISQVEANLKQQIVANGDALELTNFNVAIQRVEGKRKDLNTLITLLSETGFMSANFPKRADTARYIKAFADVVQTIDAMDEKALGICGEVDSTCTAGILGSQVGEPTDEAASLVQLRQTMLGYSYFVRSAKLILAIASHVGNNSSFLLRDHSEALRKDPTIQGYCANFCGTATQKEDCLNTCTDDRADDIATIQHNVLNDFMERFGSRHEPGTLAGRYASMLDSTSHSLISRWDAHLQTYGIKRSTSDKMPAAKWLLGMNNLDITFGDWKLENVVGSFTPPQTFHDTKIAFADGECWQPLSPLSTYWGDFGEVLISGEQFTPVVGMGTGKLFSYTNLLGKSIDFRAGCGNLHGKAFKYNNSLLTTTVGATTYAAAPIGAHCMTNNNSSWLGKDLEWCGSMTMSYRENGGLVVQSGLTTVFSLHDISLPTLAFEHGSASTNGPIDDMARLAALELASLPSSGGYQSMKSPNKGIILAIRDARRSMMTRFVLKIRDDALRSWSNQNGCDAFGRFNHHSPLTGLCYSTGAAIGNEFTHAANACVPENGLLTFGHLLNGDPALKLVTCTDAELRVSDICPASFPYRGNDATAAAHGKFCYADVALAAATTVPDAAGNFCMHQEDMAELSTVQPPLDLGQIDTCQTSCASAAFACGMGVCGEAVMPDAGNIKDGYEVLAGIYRYAPGMITGGLASCVARGGADYFNQGKYCTFTTLEAAKSTCRTDNACNGVLAGPGFFVPIMTQAGYSTGTDSKHTYYEKKGSTGVACHCFNGFSGRMCDQVSP